MQQASKIIPILERQSPEEKIEALFRSYYPLLCKSLYRILKDTEEAEDIVQETFLKLWDRRQSLEIGPATTAYLYKACYHTALNVLRQRKPLKQPDGLASMLAGSEMADGQLELQELQACLQQAIEALPPKTKLVFSLSRYEEMPYKAIAQQLDISVKAVEKHMGIALERLRHRLGEMMVFLLLISFF